MSRQRLHGLFAALLVVSCQPAPPPPLPDPGGAWTLPAATTASASFIRPTPVLDRTEQLDFWTGFAFFRDPWVAAPASTRARDGLGPLFNARSCVACHSGGGRGDSVRHRPDTVSTVFRVALEKSNGRQPHPVFGRQLQPRATYSLDADVERVAGFFVGEPRPTVRTLTQTSDRSTLSRVSAHVQGHPDVVLSGRIAPALHGLGLLEAIPEERLIELADPNDTDGDSISGTVHWRKMPSGAQRVGRFGWKAVHPSVAEQTAEAFQQDIGITSQRRLQPNCTRRQAECKVQPTGANEPGSPEIVDDLFDRVVAFTANLAVPAARPVDSRQGRQLFHAANCDGCHVPSHSVEMQNGAVSTIWPYTDLLLHDMGPDLADPVTHGDALLSEWRTAPLWGLGLALRLNQSTGLLHDGRAATVDEAILWHGGEALRSREFFEELSTSERQALVRFVLAL